MAGATYFQTHNSDPNFDTAGWIVLKHNSVVMSGIEIALRTEFPEATEAEVRRFATACEDPKKDADTIKEEAAKFLEDYLDWRSCFGLDYKKEEAETPDVEDWNFAVEKALEVNASMRRAQELEKKLAEDQKKEAQQEKAFVSYDMDFSDSHRSETEGQNKEAEEGTKTEGGTNVKEEDDGDEKATEMADDEKKKELSQIIFQHHDENGKPIKDRKGFKILHVLPGLINRIVAQADFYALALSFYLDRKFDRASEEKMTVVIDVRAGEGWPNPVAFMMVKFVRTITRQLQQRYPERLNSLVVFPVPWAAMGVWAAIKRVFRLEIMDKITLVSGPADRAAALPKAKLDDSIDAGTLDMMEQFRLDHFKPIGTFSQDD